VDYFCALDENGVRRDVAERPELRSGTVEFLASAEYMVRPPMPPAYFFAFDVSQTAVRSGFLKSAIDTVRDCLDSMQSKSDRTRIGFITYDRSIHFYGLRSTSMAPSMMVVGELNDPFAPMPDDLLVNLQECRSVVDATLDVIATSFLETDIQESAMGPALQAAYSAVSQMFDITRNFP
jgi:protein transport protein SEC24